MKSRELIHPPKLTRGFLRVWQRNFLFYRKTWVVQILWTVLEPLMYLGAIGYGLGSFISGMDGHSYVEFFFPGILCSTAMTVAFFEGTYGSFTKLTWQKTYSTMMLTRVSPEEVVFGELLWVTTKAFFSSIGVILIAACLGLVDSWRILPTLLILFATSWLFASIAMIVTSIVKNYDSFIYSTSGIIIPMSLISGIYFPIDQLPMGLKQLVWILPLAHSVTAVRETLDGSSPGKAVLHTIVLLGLGWIASNIAILQIRKKLLK